MRIKPIDGIVPLTVGNSVVEENLHRFSLLLEDVRNFGSIIIGVIFKDDKGINEYIRSVVTIFLRQIVEDIDAISILINKSSSDPCFLNLRRLFENFIYLKFILNEKSEERAKAYYVNNLLNKRRQLEEEDSSTIRGKELRARMGKDEMVKDISFPTHDWKNEVDKIDSILQKPQYQYITSEFDKRKKDNKRTQWYSLFDGPTNLESLSISVGCTGIYYLYRYYSKFSHSENELENIDSKGDTQAGLVQIRNPENAQQITLMTLNYAVLSFPLVLETLRPPCLYCYWQFYKENIRFDMTELKTKKIISVIR